FGRVRALERRRGAVEECQALARVRQPDAAVALTRRAVETGAVVVHLQLELAARAPCAHAPAPAERRSESVLDRVLDQRLDEQRGYERALRLRRHVPFHAQPVREADALEPEVALDQLQLLAERDLVPAGRGERRAQQVAEVTDRPVHGRAIAAPR